MQLTSAKNATFTGRDGRNHVAGRRAWNRKRARNLVAIAAAVEALGALLIPRTNAATVTLNADDASGTTTSFNGAGNWSGGGAPSSANDYVDSAHILRTPTSAGSITFLGNSLTLSGTGDLRFKGDNGDTITINNLTLNGGIIDNGGSAATSMDGTFTLAGTGMTLGANGGTFNTSTAARGITVSANIGGVSSGVLTITGGGTVIFKGTNSYSGGTTLAAGTLTIASGGSLSGSSTLSIANGTTLNVASGGSVTVGTFSAQGTSMIDNIAGNVTVTGGQSYIDGTTTQTGGTFTANDLEIATNGGGSGTYYLGGTGALTVGKGNYNALDIGQRASANFYVSQGGALTNTGAALVIGQNYSGASGANATVFVQQGGTVSATGASNGNIYGVSLGAQNWSGNNADQNSSGTYYLNSGTLTTTGLTFGGSTHNLGSQFIFGGGTLTTSTAFAVASVASTVETTTINSGGAIINTSGGNLTWSGNILAGTTGNVTAPTTITSSSPSGSGYATPPTVTINGGVVPPGGTAGTAVAEINQSGQVIDVVVTNPGSGYSGTETFSFSAPTSGTTATSETSTAATGNGGLTKLGANSLILAGANTYLGTNTISAGTVSLSTNGTLGAGTNPLVMAGGTTLTLATAAGTSVGTLSGAGGTITTESGYAFTANQATAATFAGTIAGAGSFIKTGAGQLTISGNNSYSAGTIISGGTLNVRTYGLPATNIAVGSAGTLQYDSSTGSITQSTATFTGTGTMVVTGGNQVTFGAGGGGAVNWTFSAGTLIHVTNNTNLTAGSNGKDNWANDQASLTIDSGSSFSTVEAPVTIDALNGGGNLSAGYNGTTSPLTVGIAGGSGTFSGAIANGSGIAAVIKAGIGTQVLTGVDTYTGSTTVSAGALNIQSNSALGTGSGNTTSGVTVASGGALQLQGGITTTTAVGLTLNGTGVTAFPNGALENVSGINNYSGLVTLGSNATIGSDLGTLNLTNTNTITGSGLGLTLTGAGNGSVASVIGTGAGGVTKTGTGTWVLSGASTYTGQTAVSAGRLYVNGSLNSGSAVSVASGAVLGGKGTVGTATVAPGGSIEGGQNGLGELTLSGLTLSGTGNINLGGLGNYTSTPAIATGAITTSGAPSSVTVSVTGTIPAVGTYEAVSYGGSITNTDYTLATLPSRATGALDFTHPGLIDIDITGTDFLVWTGAVTNTWDTANNNWKLNSNGTPTAYIDSPPDVVVFDDSAGPSNSTVNINGNDVHPLSVTFNNSTNNYLLQGTNAIAGSTGLTKAGSAQLTITNANTYTGATTISGGTLQLGDGTSGHDGLLTTSGITNNAALIYNLAGTQNVTYPISGSGTLSKLGVGTLVLTGSNSYGGGTTVSAGTLQLGNGISSLTTSGSPAGTGTFSVAGGDVLKFNFASNSSAYNYSQITGAGTVELTSTNEFDWAAGALGNTAAAFSNSFTGTLQIDNGRVPSGNLGGVTAVIVNSGGQFATYNNGNGAYTQNFTIAGNYGVESGANGAIRAQNNTFTGNIALSASATIVVGGTSTIAGPISENSAGLSFTLGNTGGYNNGTLILTGASSYTGSTTIAIGTLQLGNGTTGKDGSLTTSAITDNAILTYNLSGSETASYPISGTGVLNKAGAGTLILNSATVNTYSGGTTVSAGTLRVNNTSGSGTGTDVVTVKGGTLGGNGYIGTSGSANGAITVNSGGTIAAGASTTATGRLTSYSTTGVALSAGSAYTWKINADTSVGTAGGATGWDEIAAQSIALGSTGTPLSSSSTFTVNITGTPASGFGYGTQSFPIATAVNGITLNGTAVSNNTNLSTADSSDFVLSTSGFTGPSSASGLTTSWQLEVVADVASGQDLDLVYNATPEPGSALLLLAGAMPMLAARRRRLRRQV